MSKKLPVDPNRGNQSSTDGNDKTQILNVEHLHNHGNDLAEIAKISENNPALAEKIVDHSNEADRRQAASYRLGLVSTTILLAMVLAAVVYLTVNQGIFTMIGAVLLILAIALLIRVILTGEWSETTWFGKGVHILARALGSKESQEGEESSESKKK